MAKCLHADTCLLEVLDLQLESTLRFYKEKNAENSLDVQLDSSSLVNRIVKRCIPSVATFITAVAQNHITGDIRNITTTTDDKNGSMKTVSTCFEMKQYGIIRWKPLHQLWSILFRVWLGCEDEKECSNWLFINFLTVINVLYLPRLSVPKDSNKLLPFNIDIPDVFWRMMDAVFSLQHPNLPLSLVRCLVIYCGPTETDIQDFELRFNHWIESKNTQQRQSLVCVIDPLRLALSEKGRVSDPITSRFLNLTKDLIRLENSILILRNPIYWTHPSSSQRFLYELEGILQESLTVAKGKIIILLNEEQQKNKVKPFEHVADIYLKLPPVNIFNMAKYLKEPPFSIPTLNLLQMSNMSGVRTILQEHILSHLASTWINSSVSSQNVSANKNVKNVSSPYCHTGLNSSQIPFVGTTENFETYCKTKISGDAIHIIREFSHSVLHCRPFYTGNPILLVHGPPGCGKSFLASALSKLSGIKIFSLVLSELIQSAVGLSQHILIELFDKACYSAPSILIIENVETLLANQAADTELECELGHFMCSLMDKAHAVKNNLPCTDTLEYIGRGGVGIFITSRLPCPEIQLPRMLMARVSKVLELLPYQS